MRLTICIDEHYRQLFRSIASIINYFIKNKNRLNIQLFPLRNGTMVSYNDLLNKEKTYILYKKFKPIVANEDDKYYPYECAFDFEAMPKKIETKDEKKL